MNQLVKTFEGQNVRIAGTSDNPLFVLSDVCKVLEIGNPSQVKVRLEEHLITNEVFQTATGAKLMTVINEDGLYDVILDSRKPQAKRFRKWVTSEVLPSIRKHGAYMTPDKIEEVLLNPDTIIKLAQNLKDEQEKRLEAERIIVEQQPLVEFANTIANDKRGILIRDFAKVISKQGLSIGEKRLFQWMRHRGYLMRNNRPYQRYVEMGVLELIERPIVRTEGTEIKFTPRITGKGQEYFFNKLREEYQLVSV
ncbi:Phage antirepressor Ant [Exiguobacterium sp. 8H]|uniref:phage antirepressor n=1 Tax=unclassified Exiguobacterium TaxID=2644629 RepID=UPI0012EF2FD9|nr:MULTISPECIES: phage antirepressor KilAC domain-containing protein [unclassified Exiguobacterium]VXB53014.1 Phage antirepressor Ant [Exiguobacterium sp. 8A]VXB53666.1 Phage antirepressor Ant [Exiguobacterium sp. 8H]